MHRGQFREFFEATVEKALIEAEQAHNRYLSRDVIVEWHGAGFRGVRMSPAEGLKHLYVDEEHFFRVIDVGVLSANNTQTVMFVRASGHSPGRWDQTWDPEGSGPFQAVIPMKIRPEGQ